MSFTDETGTTIPPQWELHMIVRCILCDRDVGYVDDRGFCLGCARVNP